MIYTPDNITSLQPYEIFVYGANERGLHGAGAAKLALTWGAKMGKYGFNGQTYGIPTKDRNIKSLPLIKIEEHVNLFLRFAWMQDQYTYLVTKIGCGLAGYKESEIAPLFKSVVINNNTNIILPETFYNFI